MVKIVARKLIGSPDATGTKGKQNTQPFKIKRTEGMVVNFPKCCLPIPGDRILGFVTAGKGIVVHHQSCPNVTEYRNHPDKWINIEWEPDIEVHSQTSIIVEVTNQRGVLAKIASTIADEEANIIHLEMKDKDDRYTTLKFIVEVKNRQHLARIIRRVRSIKNVAQIGRR